MKTRVLYINTHVGESIREGGLAWALGHYDPDLVVLVEVVRAPARIAARRIFAIRRWSLTGLLPPSLLPVGSGTLIAAKRSVLKRKSWSNKLLTRQRWVNGRRDKWHPIRRLTRAVFVFRAKTSVELEVGSDHAWTHAGYPVDGAAEVPTKHREQIRAFALSADKATRRGAAVLEVGDMNEHALSLVDQAMQDAGMRPLVRHSLDGIWGNRRVMVTDTIVVPQAQLHTDHDGFLIDIHVA